MIFIKKNGVDVVNKGRGQPFRRERNITFVVGAWLGLLLRGGLFDARCRACCGSIGRRKEQYKPCNYAHTQPRRKSYVTNLIEVGKKRKEFFGILKNMFSLILRQIF